VKPTPSPVVKPIDPSTNNDVANDDDDDGLNANDNDGDDVNDECQSQTTQSTSGVMTRSRAQNLQ